MKPLVVKLGGSLAEAGTLMAWLRVLVRAKSPLVLVPGGGPMADAVRTLQSELRFDDGTAHDMAILAMQQMALAVVAMHERLTATETLVDINRALRSGRIPVWLPVAMSAKDRRIPRTWAITSDGLAARLSERLGSDCVLVKSRRVPAATTAQGLARTGVVDPTFPIIVERSKIVWRIVGPGEERVLAGLVDATEPKAVRKAAAKRRTYPGASGRRMSTRATPRGRAGK